MNQLSDDTARALADAINRLTTRIDMLLAVHPTRWDDLAKILAIPRRNLRAVLETKCADAGVPELAGQATYTAGEVMRLRDIVRTPRRERPDRRRSFTG